MKISSSIRISVLFLVMLFLICHESWAVLLSGDTQFDPKHPQASFKAAGVSQKLSKSKAASSIQSNAVVTRRIVVKFKDDLGQSAKWLTENKISFKSAMKNGSDYWDQFIVKHGVKGVFQPVFRDANEEKATGHTLAQIKAAYNKKLSIAAANASLSFYTKKANSVSRALRPRVIAPADNGSYHTYIVELGPNQDVNQVVDELMANKDKASIVYAHPQRLMQAKFGPPYVPTADDTVYNQQSNLITIGAKTAWGLNSASPNQGQGVVVAVVDSGVDYNHPAIKDNILPGYDTTTCQTFDLNTGDCTKSKSPGGDVMDNYGHGSHVAGIIAANGANNTGVYGVAPQAQIMPVKSLNDQGIGIDTDLAAGIKYAAENGADIINNSWGYSSFAPSDPTLEDAIKEAYALNKIIVFAAGNSYGNAREISPQNMKEVITVGAPGELWSNKGIKVDVYAPGYQIISLDAQKGNNFLANQGNMSSCTGCGSDYGGLSGTSMAAPHVAGAAALLKAKNPSWTNEDVRKAIVASSDKTISEDTTWKINPVLPYVILPIPRGVLKVDQAVNITQPLRVHISSPSINESSDNRIRLGFSDGTINITGTAGGQNFVSYQVLYRDANNVQWFPIPIDTNKPAVVSSTVAVDNGTLAQWDTSLMPQGDYELRLVATAVDGKQYFDNLEVFKGPSLAFLFDNSRCTNQPDMYGTMMVYTEKIPCCSSCGTAVFSYDFATKITTQMTPVQSYGNPRINADKITWTGFDSTGRFITVYDRKSQSTSVVARDQYNGYDLFNNYQLFDHKIFYLLGANYDMYYYDDDKKTNTYLTTDPNVWSADGTPFLGMYNNSIIWLDINPPTNTTCDLVYSMDITTKQKSFLAGSLSEVPIVADNQLISTSKNALNIYDLPTKTWSMLPIPNEGNNSQNLILANTSHSIKSGDNILIKTFNPEGDLYRNLYVYNMKTHFMRRVTTDYASFYFDYVNLSGKWVVWIDDEMNNFYIHYVDTSAHLALDSSLLDKALAPGTTLDIPVMAQSSYLPVNLSLQMADGSSLPQGFVFSQGTGLIHWPIAASQNGNSYPLLIKAQDASGESTSRYMTLNVFNDLPNFGFNLSQSSGQVTAGHPVALEYTIISNNPNINIPSAQMELDITSPSGKTRTNTFQMPAEQAGIDHHNYGMGDANVNVGPFAFIPNEIGTYAITAKINSQHDAPQSDFTKNTSTLTLNSIPAFQINNGASTTNSANVTLNIRDPLIVVGTRPDIGHGAQMRFSNDNIKWSDPEPFKTTKAWTLSDGGGPKTVYAQFRDVFGYWYQDIDQANITLSQVIVPVLNGMLIDTLSQEPITVMTSQRSWNNPQPTATGPSGPALINPGTFPFFQMYNLVAGTYTLAFNLQGHVFNYSITVSPNSQYNYLTLKIPVPLVKVSAGPNGTIDPQGDVLVDGGKDLTFTFTHHGYNYSPLVSVDGAAPVPVVGDILTLKNITATHTVAASFIRTPRISSSNVGTGGIIRPTGAMVPYGTSQTFSITPSAGHTIQSVSVDGVPISVTNTHTFTNVTTDHTISATFTPPDVPGPNLIIDFYNLDSTAQTTVISTPAGISCSNIPTSVNQCVAAFPSGSKVVLRATSPNNSQVNFALLGACIGGGINCFAQCTGSSCSVDIGTMDNGDREIYVQVKSPIQQAQADKKMPVS